MALFCTEKMKATQILGCRFTWKAEEDKEYGHKDNLCSCQLLRGEKGSATVALCSRSVD